MFLVVQITNRTPQLLLLLFFIIINTFPPLSKTDQHYRIPVGKIMGALAHLGI